MKKTEFLILMNDIISQFGDKHYSQKKLDLIYDALKTLTLKEFNHVLDDMIGNFKFAPTLQDFKDRSRSYLSKAIQAKPVECSLCKSSGIINVRKKTGEVGEYAFACTCDNGLQYPAFPRWRDSYRQEFTMQQIPKELVADFYGYEIKGKRGNLKL